MEVRTRAVAYGVRYRCDTCHIGEMVKHVNSSGTAILPTEPVARNEPNSGVATQFQMPLWNHKCTECGAEKGLTEAYPTVRYAVDPLPN